jgi:hypothetical protein
MDSTTDLKPAVTMTEKPESKNIFAIGFDPGFPNGQLHVRFKRKGEAAALYRYFNFTPESFEEFNASPDPDEFFYKNIRPNSEAFPFECLEKSPGMPVIPVVDDPA